MKAAGPTRGKVLFLVFGVLMLAALLTGGWYYGASRIKLAVEDVRTNLSDRGIVAECRGSDVRGYPFRLGLFCDSLAYADPVHGITVSANALRSAAQLYRPGHMVAELDGPLNMTVPGLAPMVLEWDSLRSSSRVSTDGLRRFSLVAEEVTISANDFGMIDLLGNMKGLQLHLRAGDEQDAGGRPGDLEASLTSTGWQIDDGGSNTIAKVDFAVSALIENGLAVAMSGRDPIAHLRNNGGILERSRLEFSTGDGGKIVVTGPLRIDRGGRLSGEITIDMDSPSKLVDYAAAIFPPARDMLSEPVGYLESLAEAGSGERNIRNLKLTIRDGAVLLGFIEIMQIPPLFAGR